MLNLIPRSIGAVSGTIQISYLYNTDTLSIYKYLDIIGSDLGQQKPRLALNPT